MFDKLAIVEGAVPIPPAGFTIVGDRLPDEPHPDGAAGPIAGLVCIIVYQGEDRLITCRSYKVNNQHAYVGAICHAARGFRLFRSDRIDAVYDAETGHSLGGADFFSQFHAEAMPAASRPSWGLERGRARLLIQGLQILAFMARCDGVWRPIEDVAVIEFVDALWSLKKWPNDPPLTEILAYARRLSPVRDDFCSAIKTYGHSDGSTAAIKRAVCRLIEADGVVTQEEFDWSIELEIALAEAAHDQSHWPDDHSAR